MAVVVGCGEVDEGPAPNGFEEEPGDELNGGDDDFDLDDDDDNGA